MQIIVIMAIATFLAPYAESAAMFPFTFRIPDQNRSKELSSLVMVPSIGPVSSEAQILRSIFDGFSFWTGAQAVKLDFLGDNSQSTSATSSLISTTPALAPEEPSEQTTEGMKVIETTVAEAKEPVVTSDVATSDAVVVSDDATPAPAVASSDESTSVSAIASEEVKSDAIVIISEEVKPDAAMLPEESTPSAAMASDESQPALVSDVAAPNSDSIMPVTEISSTEVPLTVDSVPEPLSDVADVADTVAEPVMQASEPENIASDLLPIMGQDLIRESTMDGVSIGVVEFSDDLNEFSFSSASVERHLDARTHTSPPPNTTTPYTPTCAYIPGASFIGFTLYALINIGSPFQCGNKYCAADWQCTHWNWYPANNGTCEIKSNPGSGWTWATPTPPSPIPGPSNWCGLIPKRACPPALISICIYIDAIISIL